MKEMPLSIGTIHFVGIGGIGMSGIAEVMRNLGIPFKAAKSRRNVKRLEALGISVAIGHAAENVASGRGSHLIRCQSDNRKSSRTF